MCPECHRIICEPWCPAYSGQSTERGRAILFCRLCEAPIWQGDKYYSVGVRQFCRSCLEEAGMDELLGIFRLHSPEEFLNILGAVSRVAFSQEEEE